MKPRKIVFTIEALTDIPIKQLRDKDTMFLSTVGENGYTTDITVNQVQANVIKPAPGK
jgi:hypothetical protein